MTDLSDGAHDVPLVVYLDTNHWYALGHVERSSILAIGDQRKSRLNLGLAFLLKTIHQPA